MEPTQIDFLVAHIESLEAENAKLREQQRELVELVRDAWREGYKMLPYPPTKRRLDEIIGGDTGGGGT